jgi:hypothetical protein
MTLLYRVKNGISVDRTKTVTIDPSKIQRLKAHSRRPKGASSKQTPFQIKVRSPALRSAQVAHGSKKQKLITHKII